MKLNFRRLEMRNFMSFEQESFDFGGRPEMVLVRGRNNDLPNETNGSGKCLSPDTVITVETSDPEIEKLLLKLDRG